MKEQIIYVLGLFKGKKPKNAPLIVSIINLKTHYDHQLGYWFYDTSGSTFWISYNLCIYYFKTIDAVFKILEVCNLFFFPVSIDSHTMLMLSFMTQVF